MCGRFTLIDISIIKEIVSESSLNIEMSPRYNIAPSQQIPVIINENGKRLEMIRWGLIPYWAKDMSIGNKLINARAETLDEKPSFRNAFKQKRCLVLADGFYEWKKEGHSKKPYRITLQDEKPFTFAGLWDSWISPAGENIMSCTIITTSPNEKMSPLHNRMPVILPREAEEFWIDPTITDTRELKELLVPYPSELIKMYEVSSIVNSPKNDITQCIEPIPNLFN